MNNKKIYLYSDLHLYHKNIRKYEPSREKYTDKELLKRIQKYQSKDNIFINLWDYFLWKTNDIINNNIKSKTNFFVNKQILIKWNHDKHWKSFWKKHFNIDIYEKRWYIVDDNIIFTHKPYFWKDLEIFLKEKGYDINNIKDKELFIIHWHTHSKNMYDMMRYDEERFYISEYHYNPRNKYQEFLDNWGIKYLKKWMFDQLVFNNGLKINYFNVSIENIGFEPIDLDTIFKESIKKSEKVKVFFEKIV